MQTEINSLQTRSFYLPSTTSSPQSPTTIQVHSSIVIVGANGSGKTRLGAWIDLESPQKALVHRVGAQKSLAIPEISSTSTMDAAENFLLYGYYQHDLALEQMQHYKIQYKWQSKPSTLLLADFTPDCWETPLLVAQKMAALITKSDHRVMEPAVGTGQIAQYLLSGSFCCEIKPNRLQHLKLKASHCHAIQADFLCLGRDTPPLSEFSQLKQGFDVVITNPAFSLAIKFIEQGLKPGVFYSLKFIK